MFSSYLGIATPVTAQAHRQWHRPTTLETVFLQGNGKSLEDNTAMAQAYNSSYVAILTPLTVQVYNTSNSISLHYWQWHKPTTPETVQAYNTRSLLSIHRQSYKQNLSILIESTWNMVESTWSMVEPRRQ